MKLLSIVGLTAVSLSVAGCAITQKVDPVLGVTTKEVCVIEDPAVRATFLQTYKRALRDKGYTVKMLEADSSITSCPVTSTYTARWSFDFTIYMAEADITVFRDGAKAGQASYDAKKGGLNLTKWIDADAKIVELTGQLFP